MKILIAEDEKDVLSAYQVALSAAGHELVTSENGEDCINLYRQHFEQFKNSQDRQRAPFDVVLLDYRMPKKDGMEVAKEILALYPRQRIIFASAHVKETLLDSVKQLNRVVELMQKPFGIKALIDTVEDKEIYDGLQALNVRIDRLRDMNPSHDQIAAPRRAQKAAKRQDILARTVNYYGSIQVFWQLLNKLRDSLQPTMERLGAGFASTGLSANFWTGLGLAVAFAAGVAYASPYLGVRDWYLPAVAGGTLLLASGFFDVIDGTVARVTKQASKKGAFLDSSFDKIAEVVIFAGIALGGFASGNYMMSFWSLVALGMSLLVSYIRARAESLGVELKGIGIGERAERLLIVAIIGMLPFEWALQAGVMLVSIVAGITLMQRIAATAKRL
ncbi:MAG: response regulator [Nitrososphaera sp.]|jgi:archaetidylinositol phosphate synthase